ncbi:UDP-N-acetylglucosamine 1-carboxyvinyltransferase [Skermanella mucosa]|uniref:UDP-N-acetylglucosamine 1-carboxyvinyltransferase n=1 Tax=Skermanella mucosa TaxID=1789672 RepID=UPI00192B40A7|nr:UDP-N-acetylglucosamine 1-carboxyvinyltransferase [Skermanella mucosa]UEM22434.1 UDP-N-acetylglucosamine 1-carboxyvinyltransferase [Skermanella mucosa]
MWTPRPAANNATDFISIEGGARLTGQVRVPGAKNATLPALVAACLSREPTTLTNVPLDLADVRLMITTLGAHGVRITFDGPSTVTLDGSGWHGGAFSPELSTRFRHVLLLMGLSAFYQVPADLTGVGGCSLGSRKHDLHAQLFSDFGYFVFDNERSFSICGGPKAETVTTSFHYPSFGATLNFLFAAAGRVGQQSILHNAALNPEVIDTITLLQSMGAEIAWDANRTLSVTGPRKLRGVSHQILGDRVFAATLAAAVACTRGEALVTGVGAEYLANEFEVWQAAGLRVQPTATGFGVACPDRLTAQDVATRPYPGFHTDIQPLHTVMMSLARGTSRVTETILDDRFRYCPELVRMGARIDVVDGGFTCVNGQDGKIAVVEGVERLHASDVQATDIRGGAAVVVAALAAEGRTSIGNIYQLDRGYADLATVLSSLGARIQRVNATYSPASSAEQNTPLNKRGAACLTPLPG